MNYFELINAVLLQLDLPILDDFKNAKLPIHNKIKLFINRANEQILTYYDWNFLRFVDKNAQNEEPLNPDKICVDGFVVPDFLQKFKTENISKTPKNFAYDEFGTLKKNLVNSHDKSILPEPYGSELIVSWVCAEINQEPNNPKYAHWKQKYNNTLAQFNASFREQNNTPKFNLKRG